MKTDCKEYEFLVNRFTDNCKSMGPMSLKCFMEFDNDSSPIYLYIVDWINQFKEDPTQVLKVDFGKIVIPGEYYPSIDIHNNRSYMVSFEIRQGEIIPNQLFTCPEFDEFKEHVMHFWRPNTEIGIIVEDKSDIHYWLKSWFKFLDDPKTQNDIDPWCVDVGPFIGIHPYLSAEIGYDKLRNQYRSEFLFLYKHIRLDKMTSELLTLGRTDFVDLWQKGPDHEYLSKLYKSW